MTLAANKLRLLQVARKRLALEEEDYRAILLNFGGFASARKLDSRGFDAVMDRFKDMGFVSDRAARNYGVRQDMASPGQVDLIRRLWAAAVDNPSDATLNAFLDHRFKVSALRFLAAGRAPGVITALRAMVGRRAALAHEAGGERARS